MAKQNVRRDNNEDEEERWRRKMKKKKWNGIPMEKTNACIRISHSFAYNWKHLNAYFVLIFGFSCFHCNCWCFLWFFDSFTSSSMVLVIGASVFILPCVPALSLFAKPGMPWYNKVAPFCHVFTAIRTINNSNSAIENISTNMNIVERERERKRSCTYVCMNENVPKAGQIVRLWPLTYMCLCVNVDDSDCVCVNAAVRKTWNIRYAQQCSDHIVYVWLLYTHTHRETERPMYSDSALTCVITSSSSVIHAHTHTYVVHNHRWADDRLGCM